jgi:hypothetical protein
MVDRGGAAGETVFKQSGLVDPPKLTPLKGLKNRNAGAVTTSPLKTSCF